MTSRWESLHLLRAVASIIVVAHHVPQFLDSHASYRALHFEAGAVGVDIFFIISGFVMYCATTYKSQNWQDFLARRAIRIIPMYWLLTLAVTLAVWGMPWAFERFRVSGAHLVKSLLFIPVFDSAGNIRPVIAVGWTLHYELLFYALVAVALTFTKTRAAALAALAVAIAVLACGALGLPQPHSAWQLLAPIALEFSLGVALAATLHSTPVLTWPAGLRAALSCGCLALAIWLISRVAPRDVGLERLSYWGSGSLLAVTALALFEPELTRASRLQGLYRGLGDASYTLYLIHGSVFPVVWKLLPGGAREVELVAWLVLLWTPVIASLPAHFWIELPMTRALTKLLTSSRPPAPELAPHPSD